LSSQSAAASKHLKTNSQQNSLTPNRDRLRHKKWRKNLTTFCIGFIDLIMINLAVIAAYYLRFHFELGVGSGFVRPVPVAPLSEYFKTLIFIDYILLILFILFKLYKRERSRWLIDEVYGILKSLSFGYIIITAVTFFVRSDSFQFSRTVLLYSFLISIATLSIWRFAVIHLERWNHGRGGNISRVLIIGTGEMARIVVRKMREHPNLGYRIIGFTSTAGEQLVDLEGHPFLGILGDFQTIAIDNQIEEVFISETELSHFKLLEIVSQCEEFGISVKMVPTVYDLLIDFADMNDLDGLPLVAVREQPMYELSLFAKRMFDIAFSSALLLVTLPLSLLITLVTLIDSGKPVVFTQIRAGVGGKPFKMYKFRTMFRDAENRLDQLVKIDELEEPVFKIKNDPRITRFGKFLRRASFDEILQFWNVLKGDMSVVGPRPEETQLVDKYNIWQRRRLKIKPGITGMQQVMCRGTTSLADRVKYDIYYLRKHSLLLDVWIICRTIPVVISGRGAC
jgi:exopolysaccharide biosynthesis polyprenyl glycosylphosphotransferase